MNDIVQLIDDLKYVFATVGGATLGGLFLWVRRSKDATVVHGEAIDRSRMTELALAASAAQTRADAMADAMGKMQHRMGELEAENRALRARTETLEAELAVLKERNTRLMMKLPNLAKSDFE